MGFLDLFRPKWRHSDADVRLEAVKDLTFADDAQLLVQVVRKDPEARVRRVALKKIDDPQLLAELAEQDPDEGLQKDAADKAQAIWLQQALAEGDEGRSLGALERLKEPRQVAEVAKRALQEAVRKAALARLTDGKALAEVARRADDPHIRLQAIERVDEPAVLREIAIHDAVKEVALAAVGRLPADAQQALENIIKKTRSKVVKNAAKEKLDALKAAQRPKDGGLSSEKRKAQLQLICRTVEEAAASDDFRHAAQAFEVSKQSLSELGIAKGEESFQKRFDKAWLKFQARREEHSARERAREALLAKQKAEAEARKLEAETRAVEDAAHAEEDQKLREIADAAKKEADERRAAERARRAEEKAAREAEKAARDAERAAARARKEAEAEENARRLEEVAARLESLAGSDDRKLVEGALKSGEEVARAGASLPKSAEPIRERYQKAREKLVIRLSEMKDAENWKRWANVPRLESLCQRMEALLTAPEDADLKKMSADLKALQTEWKSVGPAPKEKSEALWKRFKETSDQVYARCKAQFAATDEARKINLEKKEALAQRVVELAALPDDQVNWKETAETIKALQEEWKGIGQVPNKDQADAVWKKFRGACDQFFERRKAHFQVVDEAKGENLKKLEALIARASELAALPDERINWKDTAEELKGLQADWKTIGHVGKKESEDAWKRFREACDRFFERRKAHFDKLDEERAANLKAKELLCEKVEALAEADDLAAATAEVKKLQAEWKTTGPAPRDAADAVWNRFRAACDRVFDLERAPAVPEPAAAAGGEPAPSSWFSNKLPLAGIAEKLAQKAEPKPAPVEKPAAPVEKPVAAEPAPKLQPLGAIDDTLAAAASEWEDIATGAGQNPLKKPE